MEKAQNFPSDTIQTVGPVKKQNIDTKTTDNQQPLNYTNAQQSGPVYKAQMQDKEESKPEEPVDNNENNTEQDKNQ